MTQQRSELTTDRKPGEGQFDAGGVMLLVTLTVLIVLHKKVGYGLLRLRGLFLMALAMAVLNWFDHLRFVEGLLGGRPNSADLQDYGFEFLLVSVWLHFKRKREKWNINERPHAYSLGETRLGFLPIREDHIYRWVEPFVVLLAGLLLHYRLGFEILGFWVSMAAGCLFVTERAVYRQTEQHDWDMGDGLIEARRDSGILSQATETEAPRGCLRPPYRAG